MFNRGSFTLGKIEFLADVKNINRGGPGMKITMRQIFNR